MENYGKTISRLRKQKGLTQNELGTQLNVTYQAVSKWENDLSQPDFDTIVAMCKIFGITVDEFTKIAHGEEITPHAEVAAEASVTAAAAVEKPEPVKTETVQPVPVRTTEHVAPAVYTRQGVSGGFLIGLISAVLVGAGIFIGISCIVGWNAWWLGLIAGYMVFSFIALIGHDTVVWDFLLSCLTNSIHMPGIIFSLDLDSILFMLAYKFIIAPLVSVFLWFIFVLAGFFLSFFMAAFVFPFKIPKLIKETFIEREV